MIDRKHEQYDLFESENQGEFYHSKASQLKYLKYTLNYI